MHILKQNLTDINEHGDWYSVNGRQYILSKNTLDVKRAFCLNFEKQIYFFFFNFQWQSASDMCFALGMKILSLEFNSKYASLKQGQFYNNRKQYHVNHLLQFSLELPMLNRSGRLGWGWGATRNSRGVSEKKPSRFCVPIGRQANHQVPQAKIASQ